MLAKSCWKNAYNWHAISLLHLLSAFQRQGLKWLEADFSERLLLVVLPILVTLGFQKF